MLRLAVLICFEQETNSMGKVQNMKVLIWTIQRTENHKL